MRQAVVKWYEMKLPAPPTDDDDPDSGDWCPDEECIDEGEAVLTQEDSQAFWDGEPRFSYLADAVAEYLMDGCVMEPSSSRYYPGVWWTTEAQMNMYTGESSRRSYHVSGLSEREEWLVWLRVEGKVQ